MILIICVPAIWIYFKELLKYTYTYNLGKSNMKDLENLKRDKLLWDKAKTLGIAPFATSIAHNFELAL